MAHSSNEPTSRQGLSLKRKTQVFAILRFDSFQDPSVAIQNRVTVTKIVLDRSVADAEVQRLNKENGAKSCIYFCQSTRLVEASEQPSEPDPIN